MKRMKWIAIMIVGLVLVSFTFADAQRWGGKGKWPGWGTNYYHWNWNPVTVETLKGEVMTKDTITPVKGQNARPAVGMTLKKGDNYAVYVHLGPQWYFDKQDLSINIGDKVEITGSKIMVEGETVILVSSIKKGDKIWQFRDQQGFPYWSGRR